MDCKKVSKVSLKEISGLEFVVPSYQRGYRWNTIHVEQFIDDIYEDDGEYCIQPLIIKKINKEYFVIDGQQRLTTLVIMIGALKYLNKGEFEEDISVPIGYQTRNQNKDLLDFLVNHKQFHMLSAEKLNDKDLIQKIKSDINLKPNLDFDYMLNTFLVAKKKYFEKHNEEDKSFETMYKRLINECKIIWYPIDDNSEDEMTLHKQQEKNSEIEKFSKINMGKIPLTNAELIKAEFMNPSYYDYNYKSEIKLIAEQWYYIENDLHKPDFWAFIPHENQYEDNNSYRTRIDEIFLLLLIKKHMNSSKNNHYSEEYREKMLQEFFLYNQVNEWIKSGKGRQCYKKNIFAKWEELKETYEIIKELYEHDGRTQIYEHSNDDSMNIGLYNFMGYFLYASRYILNEDKYNVCEEICEIISKNRNDRLNVLKQKLWDKMKKMILVENTNELRDCIEKLKYIENDEENNNKIRAILLLYNILLMSKNKGVGNRYDFLRFNRWSLEHIHSQKEELIEHKKKQIEKLKNKMDEIEKSTMENIEKHKRKKYEEVNKIKDLTKRQERTQAVEKSLEAFEEKYIEEKEKKLKEIKLELKKFKSVEEVRVIRKEIIKELNTYYEEKESSNNANQINRISLLFKQLENIESQNFEFYLNEEIDLRKVLIPENSEKHKKVLVSKIIKVGIYSTLEEVIMRSNNFEDMYNKVNKSLQFGIKLAKENQELEESYNAFRDYKNSLQRIEEQDEYYISKIVKKIELQVVDGFFRLLKEEKRSIYKENIRNLILDIYNSEIDEYFKEKHNKLVDDQSIKNLTLLRGEENRKIANEYIKKKEEIYKCLKRGTVIPYSTLLVFFDAYSNIDSINAGEKWQWLPRSRDKYFEDLMESIEEFFDDKCQMKEN